MATAVKRKLSGSTDGRGIKVVATASAGTTIHTAVAGTTAGTFDEIWLYAYNSDSVARLLTIEFGGTTAPDDNIKVTLASQSPGTQFRGWRPAQCDRRKRAHPAFFHADLDPDRHSGRDLSG